ncbi:MAG: DUF1850 domain-containing protein [Fretibacterium sp.]|nr:DUF1850 domain-containing protein [Fretibacterium sp.]
MRRNPALFWVPLLGLSALFLSLAALAPQVTLRGEDGEALQVFRLYLGDFFETQYVHSVQLCPVVDRYYATRGTLWLWEERTQSTNAGLPTEAPFRGRFLRDGSWFRYVGGGRSFEEIALRVGDERWGLNTLTPPNGKTFKLFAAFPGRKILIRAD